MHTELEVYIRGYVVDVLTIGALWVINKILPLLTKRILIKPTGEVGTKGSAVVLIGRNITIIGFAIKFRSKGNHLEDELT